MEKSSMERDLDDWEFLSDDGFLDLGGHHDSGKSVLFTRGTAGFGPKGLVDVNYFVCPPNPPHLLIGGAEGLIPTKGFKAQAPPGRSEPAAETNPDEGFIKDIKEIRVAPPVMLANQEVISQVFFRKLGESEFVDMKMDSPPKSPTARSVKQPLVQVAGPMEYEEKGGEEDPGNREDQGHGGGTKMAAKVEEEGKEAVGSETKGKGCWESFGFSIWRWRITGVGALCSLGVAAATICILILSGRQRQKHQQQNQKHQFHIHHDEKSIKQAVQQATRINQAISVVRGVPMTRAHISFGGYYDGL